MWLFTPFGFFSAVQKPGQSCLTIRARVAGDLDNLRQKYLPELSATTSKGGTDYPYRATVTHAAFAQALAQIVKDIDYSNFKNEVAAQQGHQRAHAYHEVWDAVFKLQKGPTPETASPKKSEKAGKAHAFGGIVFNKEGKILLFEPKGHYDGYVWTFPKGKPHKDETPEQTALREVGLLRKNGQ